MRNAHIIIGLAVVLGSAATAAAGCGQLVNDYYLPLTDPRLATTGSGGHDGGTGGSGGGKPDCSGDPSDKNTIDDCGVFAQADAPANGDGKMATPYAKLADAVAEAQTTGKRVYACTSAPFGEAVTISAGVEVYGGFDCTKGWTWSQDGRATLNGPADGIALTITSAAGGAKVEGFAITAASPSAPKGGGSSIAVAVDDVAATLEQCDVKAGDAADGVDGVTPGGMATPGADAPPPDAMTENACINALSLIGGPPGATTCDDGMTAGGAGGKGGITGMNNGDGADGVDGTPAGNMNHGSGANMANDCNDATKGKNGDAGAAGPGGSAMGDVLSLNGVTNDDATDGTPGTKAQGGGGGGGAKSGVFCAGGVDGNGASGGGGGAGGCGGKGGGGGKAGGSSVAIVSLGTQLVLTEVTLAVGKGGKGGSGAVGQTGGPPGAGAFGGASSGIVPSKAGCQGGAGGTGGDGGPGGGSRGGHAIGLAYASAPSPAPMIKTYTPGTPGDGGTAGAGAPMTSNGAQGAAAQCWDFANNAACM